MEGLAYLVIKDCDGVDRLINLRKLLRKLVKKRLLIWLVSLSGTGLVGRASSWFASIYRQGYKSQATLASLHSSGFISYSASIAHSKLQLGEHVYLGDRVAVYRSGSGGEITLADSVKLYSDIIMETTDGGSISVGESTHIQPRCHFVAGVSSIIIGRRCEIAPACAFYPFNHGVEAGEPVQQQPLISKGNIEIGDDVWLGYGVVVLDGVKIGDGAVIGANSVITRDIPENAIAVGSPAKVIRMR